ncbi:MAG: response regulator [Chloroflexales bacterium]|nr:response regulator [Chloroflexales bacterium]
MGEARRGDCAEPLTNGREAVELVRALRPDVIVMDMLMPVLTGIEAIRQIRQEQPASSSWPASPSGPRCRPRSRPALSAICSRPPRQRSC